MRRVSPDGMGPCDSCGAAAGNCGIFDIANGERGYEPCCGRCGHPSLATMDDRKLMAAVRSGRLT